MIRTGRNRRAGEEALPSNVLDGILPFLLGETHMTQAAPIQTVVERIGDCRICGEEFRSRGLICSADKHRVCRTCVGGYARQQVDVLEGGSLDKFRELTKNGGRLSCAEPACKGILHTDDMYNLVDWKLLGVLAEWASRANRARRAEEGENLGADGAGALFALFPNAVMCPKCLCGLVEPAYCDDMEAHQGQIFASSTSPVDNRCPRCKWFGSTRQDWIRWDGVIRHAIGVADEQMEDAP